MKTAEASIQSVESQNGGHELSMRNGRTFQLSDKFAYNPSKGDTIKFGHDGQAIHMIEEIVQDGDRGSGENVERSSRGKDSGQNPSKQDRIRVNTAFQKAVDQVDRRSCETRDDYKEMLLELTEIHDEVLQEVRKQ